MAACDIIKRDHPIPVKILATEDLHVTRSCSQCIDHDLCLVNSSSVWKTDVTTSITISTLCQCTYCLTTFHSYCLCVSSSITTAVFRCPCSCYYTLESSCT